MRRNLSIIFFFYIAWPFLLLVVLLTSQTIASSEGWAGSNVIVSDLKSNTTPLSENTSVTIGETPFNLFRWFLSLVKTSSMIKPSSLAVKNTIIYQEPPMEQPVVAAPKPIVTPIEKPINTVVVCTEKYLALRVRFRDFYPYLASHAYQKDTYPAEFLYNPGYVTTECGNYFFVSLEDRLVTDFYLQNHTMRLSDLCVDTNLVKYAAELQEHHLTLETLKLIAEKRLMAISYEIERGLSSYTVERLVNLKKESIHLSDQINWIAKYNNVLQYCVKHTKCTRVHDVTRL